MFFSWKGQECLFWDCKYWKISMEKGWPKNWPLFSVVAVRLQLFSHVRAISWVAQTKSLLTKKLHFSYLIYESDWRRFEWVLFWQMYPHFPHPTFVRSAFGPEEFDHEFIETSQNGYFMFWLYEFYHVSVHPSLPCGRWRHFEFSIFKKRFFKMSESCLWREKKSLFLDFLVRSSTIKHTALLASSFDWTARNTVAPRRLGDFSNPAGSKRWPCSDDVPKW